MRKNVKTMDTAAVDVTILTEKILIKERGKK